MPLTKRIIDQELHKEQQDAFGETKDEQLDEEQDAYDKMKDKQQLDEKQQDAFDKRNTNSDGVKLSALPVCLVHLDRTFFGR